MADQPQILQPREAFVDDKGFVSRAWYRFLQSLGQASGSLLNPLVIPSNSIFDAASISNGGTLVLADSPAATLLGNSSNSLAPPSPQVVATSLSFTGGTLAAASLAPGKLSGNPGAIDAPPTAINLGANLSMDGDTLNVTTGTGGVAGLALIETVAYWGM